MDLNFHLLKTGKGPIFPWAEPQFWHRGNILRIGSTSWDRDVCKELDKRLLIFLPRHQWNLWVTLEAEKFKGDWITVEVHGEMLKPLCSLLMYGVQAGAVRMELQATLELELINPLAKYFRTIRLAETLLTPTTPKEHDSYSANFLLVGPGEEPLDLGLVSKWRLSQIQLIVKGVTFDPVGSIVGSLPSLEANRILWDRREAEGDVKIIGRGGDIIPCHGSVLCDQSPVFAAMLEGGHFLEGTTRQIRMEDWAPEKILAFLAFLYCRDTDAAERDPGIALSVLEMGHMYAFELMPLQDSMRQILLGGHPSFYSRKWARRIRNFGAEKDDLQMRWKGWDVRAWLMRN